MIWYQHCDTIGQWPSLVYTTVAVEKLVEIPVISDELSRELLLYYHQLLLYYHQLSLYYHQLSLYYQ